MFNLREGNAEMLLPVSQIRKARFCDVHISSPHIGSAHFGTAVNQITFFSERISRSKTLLMLAAYAGHAEFMRGLIQRGLGADPNRLDDLGQVPSAGAIFKRGDKVCACEAVLS